MEIAIKLKDIRKSTLLLISISIIYSLISTPTLSTAQSCVSPPSGLISWWPGDGNAEDIFDGYDGALVGDTTFASGKVDQAFSLDGNSDYIDIGAGEIGPNLDFNSDHISVEAWVKTNVSNGTWQHIVTKRNCCTSSNFQWSLQTDDNIDKWVFGVAVGGSDNWVASTSSVSTSWTHLVGTYDGETVRIYVNGVLENQNSFPSGPINTKQGLPVVIGARADGLGSHGRLDFFNGLIDEVEIHNRALTAPEIQSIYNASSAGKCKPRCIAPPSNLISWWPADGNARDIISGNDGALMNAVRFGSGKNSEAFILGNLYSVRIPYNVILTPVNQITIDAWVKPAITFTQPYAPIIGKNPTPFILPFTDYFLGMGGNPMNPAFQVSTYGPTNYFVESSVSIPANQWSHVAGTYNGSAVKIYVNGVLRGSAPASGPIFDSTLPAYIGQSNTVNGHTWSGKIDEIEIYDRALSDAEILAIYNSSGAGKCKPVCGDGICNQQTENLFCVSDCGLSCGDGICSYKVESTSSCPQDCGPACPTNGMVAWFPGDKHTNDNIKDISGNFRDGSQPFGSAKFSSAKVNAGFSFDKTSTYFELPKSTTGVGTPDWFSGGSATLDNLQEGSYSLEAWYYPNSIPSGSGSDNYQSQGIIEKQGNHEGIKFDNSAKFVMEHWLSGSVYTAAVSTHSFPAGSFYHVVGVVDKPSWYCQNLC